MKEIDRQQKDTTPLVSRHTDVTEARATETKSARVFTRRAASERTAEEKGMKDWAAYEPAPLTRKRSCTDSQYPNRRAKHLRNA